MAFRIDVAMSSGFLETCSRLGKLENWAPARVSGKPTAFGCRDFVPVGRTDTRLKSLGQSKSGSVDVNTKCIYT